MKIVGSQAQVTGALVTTNTLVAAEPQWFLLMMQHLEMEMDKPLILVTSALSAIGGKTTGTVTVDNAVKIVGSQAQVTGAGNCKYTGSSRNRSGFY